VNRINLFEPSYGQREIQAITEILNSKWTGRGVKTKFLEESFASFLNVEEAKLTLTTCATEGLFAIFDAISLNSNDEVIIPTTSFVGVANAITYYGGKVVFCDTHPNSLLMNHDDALTKISSNTRAIVLNHYGGYASCDMKFIENLKDMGIIVIEDAACAFGARIDSDTSPFLGTLADFGIWSFDSMKLLSMGDGGLIYAKDESQMDFISKRNYFGLAGDGKTGFANASINRNEWWEFSVELPGRRAIINDLQASIGIVQLERFDEMCNKRRMLLELYLEILTSFKELDGLQFQSVSKQSSPYLVWIQHEERNELANFLLKNGIYTSFRYLPLHRQRFFNPGLSSLDEFPGAEWSYTRTLNLPLHSNLSKDNVEFICDSIRNFLRG